jgi:O-antigen/teichoic acid export membrane protein
LERPIRANLPSKTMALYSTSKLDFCARFAALLGQPHQGARLRTRFFNGTIWSVIAAGVAQGLALPLSIFVARLLGRAGFGELGIIQGTVSMLGTMAGLGLSSTAVKYVAEFRVIDPCRAGRIIGLSIAGSAASSGAIGALLLLLSPLLAATTLNAPRLAGPLRLSSLLVTFTALNGAQVGIMCGLEAYRTMSRTNFWRGVVAFPAVALGTLFWGLSGTMIGYIVAGALGVLLNHFAIEQDCRRAGIGITYSGWWTEKNILWKFSLPALLGALPLTPAAWIASTIIVHQQNGYLELGLFNAANQWRTALMFLPNTLGQVATPMLSSLLAIRNTRGAENVLLATTGTSALLVIPAAVALGLCSNQVMRLYGTSFAYHALPLILICLVCIVIAIQTPLSYLIIASGRMWYGTALNYAWTVAFLISSWLFLHLGWGASGLAGSYLAAYSVSCVWTIRFAFKFSRSMHDPQAGGNVDLAPEPVSSG